MPSTAHTLTSQRLCFILFVSVGGVTPFSIPQISVPVELFP
jgi:hypothetical protein